MEIDPEIAASETAYIQFTIPTGDKTETETIPVSEAERKDGCYVFQCDVAAKEMTSEIKAQIIDPESGKSGAVYTYSVKVSETQMLCVEVAFEEKEWNILRWQTVSTTEWSESDGLAVWKG